MYLPSTQRYLFDQPLITVIPGLAQPCRTKGQTHTQFVTSLPLCGRLRPGINCGLTLDLPCHLGTSGDQEIQNGPSGQPHAHPGNKLLFLWYTYTTHPAALLLGLSGNPRSFISNKTLRTSSWCLEHRQLYHTIPYHTLIHRYYCLFYLIYHHPKRRHWTQLES